MSPEIIQAIVTGAIIGIGMVLLRVSRRQNVDAKQSETLNKVSKTPPEVRLSSTNNNSGTNGFKVAMESVRESHQLSVAVLREQVEDLQVQVNALRSRELELEHLRQENQRQAVLIATMQLQFRQLLDGDQHAAAERLAEQTVED